MFLVIGFIITIQALGLCCFSDPHPSQDHMLNTLLSKRLLGPSQVFSNQDNGLQVKLGNEGWEEKFCGLSTCFHLITGQN